MQANILSQKSIPANEHDNFMINQQLNYLLDQIEKGQRGEPTDILPGEILTRLGAILRYQGRQIKKRLYHLQHEKTTQK